MTGVRASLTEIEKMNHTLHFFDGIEPQELENFTHVVGNAKQGDEIIMEFCNGGGSVFHGIAICDMMAAAREKGIHFTSNVWGYAASAACLVALSADKVFMSPNSAIMYHSAWCAAGEDAPGIAVANSAQQRLLQSRISKISAKDFDGDETWITAAVAKDLGIIDGIIGNSAREPDDARNIRLAARYIYGRGTMSELKEKAAVEAMKAEAPCNEEEKNQEQPKAEDASAVDVLEKVVQRLDEIEHRLAVLEGEGKKADDEAEIENGDQIAARLNGLYARLTAEKPVVSSVTGNAAVSKQSKLEASFERSKAINLKAYM